MSKKNKTDILSEDTLDKVSGGTEIVDNESIKINHDIFDTSIKLNNVDFNIKINNSDFDSKINFNNFDPKINFNNFDPSIKINNKSDIKTLKND